MANNLSLHDLPANDLPAYALPAHDLHANHLLANDLPLHDSPANDLAAYDLPAKDFHANHFLHRSRQQIKIWAILDTTCCRFGIFFCSTAVVSLHSNFASTNGTVRRDMLVAMPFLAVHELKLVVYAHHFFRQIPWTLCLATMITWLERRSWALW